MFRHLVSTLAAALTIVAAALPAVAGVDQTTSVAAAKTATPPALSAALTDPAWTHALTAADFTDFTDRVPAKLRTVAYFLYDDHNLYIAFHAEQHGVPIIATQNVDHIGLGTDDHVTVWLDTSGNGARVYSFAVSPRGVRSESSSENTRFAPTWQSAAHVDANGDYNVMMIVPLTVLRAQGTRVQNWRINFERYIPSLNQDYTWAYALTQTSVSNAQYWPTLTGITIASSATRPKPHADVYWLGSGGSDRDIFQNGIGRFQPTTPRSLGLDATFPFTNTLAFVGTLNPDFSNVEQDQTTISPQEFQINYSEYRPFFVQGAGYINTLPSTGNFGSGTSMFYTPSIGIFSRGLKIEGTAGQNAFGALNALGTGFDDSALGYTFARPDNSLAVSAEGVFADHAGVNDDTTGIGISQVNPHSGQYLTATYAADRGARITSTAAADALSLGGGVRTQRLSANAGYQDIGPQYAPIDGFVSVNDSRGVSANVQYAGVGTKTSPLQSYDITVFGDRYLDRTGAARQADENVIYNIRFKNQISLNGFAGPSELRSYQNGFPAYTGGQTFWYNRRQINVGYRDQTSSPINFAYTWGPFNGFYVQQLTASSGRTFGTNSVSFQYDGSIERNVPGVASLTTQWLRRITFTHTFGRSAALSVAVRGINGTGGFALPGSNLAFAYQQRYANENMLFIAYGTPAASQTLHRLIVKYVFHAGGGSGT